MTQLIKRKAYTIAEVAAMFGRDRTTIWRWVQRGALQSMPVPDGRLMVTAASLERLVGEPMPEELTTLEASPEPRGKRGRPRIAGVRPWAAEGVSRRTWERRRKA